MRSESPLTIRLLERKRLQRPNRTPFTLIGTYWGEQRTNSVLIKQQRHHVVTLILKSQNHTTIIMMETLLFTDLLKSKLEEKVTDSKLDLSQYDQWIWRAQVQRAASMTQCDYEIQAILWLSFTSCKHNTSIKLIVKYVAYTDFNKQEFKHFNGIYSKAFSLIH